MKQFRVVGIRYDKRKIYVQVIGDIRRSFTFSSVESTSTDNVQILIFNN